jgi:hypothetical protein
MGALVAVVALVGDAAAQTLDLGPPRPADFTQVSSDFHGQSTNLLNTPSETGTAYPPDSSYSLAQPAELAHDWSLSVFYAYEGFRGVSDGNWENNGLNTGFNYGTRLGRFSDATGIGLQMGGSIGIYNWSGTDYRIQNNDEAQTQGFLTMGFFRKAQPESPWAAGVVFDLMLNNNFGVFNESPTLDQFRYQVGYDVNDCDEIGVWGTVRADNSTRNVPFMGRVTWQAMDQVDVFTHHKWQFGADTSFWVGAPLGNRLRDGASLGSFIAGARGDLPLSTSMSIYTVVTYMRPAVGAGPAGGQQDEWSFAVGLALFPRHDSRTPTVAREGWSPLLPVASNGTFFVDSSKYY